MAEFGEVDLMTRAELASALIDRTKRPALVIFEEDDGTHFQCFHSFAPEGEEARCDVPALLRVLADRFEGAEFHPAEEA